MTRRGHSGMGMTKKRDGLGTGVTKRRLCGRNGGQRPENRD